MRFYAAGMGVLLCCLASARAQVQVDVEFDQNQFLPSERLVAKVRVTNFSGQTLHLGEGESWLSFNIERRGGLIVSKLKAVPVAGAFTLESSETGTKQVDLAPCFDLTRPANYTVVADVFVPDLNETVQSPVRSFTVAKGTKLWDLDFGVPVPTGEKRRPEIRKYALIQANLAAQLQLYFRLSNAEESETYQIYPIGRMLSFSYPEHQIDKRSQLHVIYQDSSRRFKYFVFNPDGEMILRQTYYYSDTRPKLAVNQQGEIHVAGGARYPNSTDIPQPSAAASSTDAKDTTP